MGILAAALAFTLSLAAIAGVTRPEVPQAVASTTTTSPEIERPTTTLFFTLEDDTPLEWHLGVEIPDTRLIATVPLDEDIYLFTTVDPFEDRDGTDLAVWRSSDGAAWEPLGHLRPPGVLIEKVTSTVKGLIALGSAAADGTPWVAMSDDGVTWREATLPAGDSPPGGYWLQAADANKNFIVVAGTPWGLPQTAIAEAIEGRLGGDDVLRYGWGLTGYSRISVYGPLGITVYEGTAEDLGLDETVFQGIGGTPQEAAVWVSDDGTSWARAALEDAYWINGFFTAADGALRAMGGGYSGEDVWSSPDGRHWESLGPRIGPWEVVDWGGRYIGVGPGLLASDDGDDWERLPLRSILPAGSWDTTMAAAGGAGLAVLVTDYSDTGGPWPPAPHTLTRDGYTLTITEEPAMLTIERAGARVLTVPRWTDRVTEGVRVDFGGETAEFLDPETNEVIVVFTFDELDAAEEEMRAASREDMPQFLAQTIDMRHWSLHDLGDVVDTGGSEYVSDIVVTDDGIVITVVAGEQFWYGRESTTDVRVFAASLP